MNHAPPPSPKIPADRIVVMMPNWLGDAVMASPFLRALRTIYPTAHIAAVARPLTAPVLTGLSFINDMHILDKSNPRATLDYLKQNHFDLGILLPNSFRSAWLLFRGQVKNRLGYARDLRSPLLTHRLQPVHRTAAQTALDQKKNRAIRSLGGSNINIGSAFQPQPTIDYYLEFSRYLCGDALSPASRGLYADRMMQLAVTPDEKSEADQVLALAGISPDDNVVVIVPGANFGSSKCWLPERFAQVADRIMDRPEKGGTLGAHVILASSPAELPIVDAILAASQLCPNGGGIGRLHALAKLNNGKGISLGALKAIVRRSRLMLCNDTGPRHFAAAFNIPTVTLFGPTDPVWAETYSRNEKILRVDVPCGPCQLKKCPIDHRCMKSLTVEMVMAAITDLWHNQPKPEVTAP